MKVKEILNDKFYAQFPISIVDDYTNETLAEKYKGDNEAINDLEVTNEWIIDCTMCVYVNRRKEGTKND